LLAEWIALNHDVTWLQSWNQHVHDVYLEHDCTMPVLNILTRIMVFIFEGLPLLIRLLGMEKLSAKCSDCSISHPTRSRSRDGILVKNTADDINRLHL